jgi:hypothetical protein
MGERRRIEGGRGPLKAGGCQRDCAPWVEGAAKGEVSSKGGGGADEPAGELSDTILVTFLRLGQDSLDVGEESGFTPTTARCPLGTDRVPLVSPLDECPGGRLVIIGGVHVRKTEGGLLFFPGVLVHKGT